MARDVGADAVHVSDDVSGYAQRRERALAHACLEAGIHVEAARRASRSYRPGRSSPATDGEPLQGVHAVLPALVWRRRRRALVAGARRGSTSPPGVDPGALPALAELVERRRGHPRSMPGRRVGGARAGSTRGSTRVRGYADAPRRPARRRHVAAVALPALRLRLAARGRARASPGARAPTRSCGSSAGATSTSRSSRPVPTPRGPTTGRVATNGTTTPKRSTRGRRAAPATRSSTRACASSRQEGFMHNRARMIVASFLTKDLYVDWRDGRPPLPRSAASTATSPTTTSTGSGSPAPAPTPTRTACSTRPCRASASIPTASTCAATCPSCRAVHGGAVHDPDAQGPPRLRLPRAHRRPSSRGQGRSRPPPTGVNDGV